MEYSDTSIKEARDFGEHYVHLLEEHCNRLLYNLGETATLDWFGRTVKGPHKISTFLENEIKSARHQFPHVLPSSQSIVSFRPSHNITTRSNTMSVKRKLSTSPIMFEEKTPPKQIAPQMAVSSCNVMLEMGQGDGHHVTDSNCPSPLKRHKHLITDNSGVRSDNDGGGHVEPEKGAAGGDGSSRNGEVRSEQVAELSLRYVTLEGHMEFRRPSTKKFQTHTKWLRPCKLHIGYSGTTIEDSTIYLIIYEGNVRCRRNLLKEFDATGDND